MKVRIKRKKEKKAETQSKQEHEVILFSHSNVIIDKVGKGSYYTIHKSSC